MPDIKLSNIRNFIFNDLNMEIFDREMLAVIGQNGAGKSTLLNTIAGLVDYDGSVHFDGVLVNRMPANERNVGYLFQNPALFPHLDVASNIGYGLTVRGERSNSIKNKVDELLDLMNISHLRERYPKNLSGGEQQRTALARALAISPKVLLLDEPFSSLDSQTCGCIRQQIRKIHTELGITTVLVTHNLAEAQEMGDRIVAMNNGGVVEVNDLRNGYGIDYNSPHNMQQCSSCTIDCNCEV